MPEAEQIAEVPLEDRWIFSRLNRCAEQVNRAIEQYRFHEAAQTLWHFFWHEFCDWYLELKKLRFHGELGTQRALAQYADRLRNRAAAAASGDAVPHRGACGSGSPDAATARSRSRWPPIRSTTRSGRSPAAEREMAILQEIITSARDLRADMKLDPKQQLEGALLTGPRRCPAFGEAILRLAASNLDYLRAEPRRSRRGRASTPEFDWSSTCPQAQIAANDAAGRKRSEQLERTSPNSSANSGTKSLSAGRRRTWSTACERS